MAWFWQQKKEEQEKAAAQKKSVNKKRDLIKDKIKDKAANDKKSKRSKAKKGAKPPVKSAPKPQSTGDAYKILLGPIITEKTARLAEEGTYVFAVSRLANKISIAGAVRSVYGVDPVKVTKSSIKGKKKIFSGRRGQRAGVCKAFVTLKSGQTIELFEKV